MKILVICQYYSPEPFRVTDICEELVCQGNEVTVVTGTPNYPMGNVYPGYEHGQRAQEVINGVRIIRCLIHPRKTGAIHRLWNYYSYPFHSKRAVKQLDGDFDVVFIYQLSPVMMAKAGVWYAKKHHIKSVLYCLDLWPASLNVGGLSGGVVYKWFERESKKIYQAVDQISVSSKSFADYFSEQFDLKNTKYLPQYAESTFSPDECRKVPDGYIDLMFAGNIGTAQNVDTIIKAAVLCKDIPNLRWHIVGDGIELSKCKKLAEESDVPVIFYGRQPVSEMPRFYAMADAMIVTMKRDPIISLTLPGKVQSYMAAGKPIIGAIDGEANTVIKESGCGFCGDAEDPSELAENIRKFVNSKDRANLEHDSRKYYDENFNKELFLSKLALILKGNY